MSIAVRRSVERNGPACWTQSELGWFPCGVVSLSWVMGNLGYRDIVNLACLESPTVVLCR